MHALLATLSLPARCEVCHAWPSERVCRDCRDRFGRLQSRCPGCALPLAPGLDRCGDCQARPASPLSACTARVPYTWPWTDVIGGFKFRGQPAWARHLAAWMLEDAACAAAVDAADVLMPIPLPRSRLLQRGYNQAWELARHLKRQRRHPRSCWNGLQREDTALAQHDLDRGARLAHARQALSTDPAAHSAWHGAHVLLVDDVMTTGATLEAAAACLLEAGAKRVSAAVFARTPAPGSL